MDTFQRRARIMMGYVGGGVLLLLVCIVAPQRPFNARNVFKYGVAIVAGIAMLRTTRIR